MRVVCGGGRCAVVVCKKCEKVVVVAKRVQKAQWQVFTKQLKQ